MVRVASAVLELSEVSSGFEVMLAGGAALADGCRGRRDGVDETVTRPRLMRVLGEMKGL